MSAITLMKSPSSVVSKITPLTVPSASGTARLVAGPRIGCAEVAAGLHFQLCGAAFGGLEATEGEAEVGAVAARLRQFVEGVFRGIGRA